MKRILIATLLSFAILAPAASAATARSAPATAPAPAPVSTPAKVPAPAPAPATTAAPALAPAPAPAPDSSRWRMYVGAQLGDSVVGGLIGLQINKTYSLEARYDYVDPIYQPNNTVESSNADISGLAMFPLKLGNMDPLFIYAKAGYERTTEETTITDPGLPGITPPTTTTTTVVNKRVTAGAGLQHDFSNNATGRIGVNAVGSNHTVYLTAIYKF